MTNLSLFVIISSVSHNLHKNINTMISVIETGGKQYLVKTGDTLKIEKIEAEVGTKIAFDRVFLTANDDGTDTKIGTPVVEGVKIEAEVLEQAKGKKIRVEKFKRKIRYHKVFGHRQYFTKIKIV